MQRVDPYGTAAELKIKEWEREGLIATMRDLRAGTPPRPFNMGFWDTCICGQINAYRGRFCAPVFFSPALSDLFLGLRSAWGRDYSLPELREISMAQAADAIQNFLLTVAPPPWRRRTEAFFGLCRRRPKRLTRVSLSPPSS